MALTVGVMVMDRSCLCFQMAARSRDPADRGCSPPDRRGGWWDRGSSRLQRLHAGQLLAFHPFEEGAAGGGDEGEVRGDSGVVEGGHRPAAAGGGGGRAATR